jgi:hypothetical protein
LPGECEPGRFDQPAVAADLDPVEYELTHAAFVAPRVTIDVASNLFGKN